VTAILIADDHPMFRDAMRLAISSLNDDLQLIETGSFETALAALSGETAIDLGLIDLRMPGMQGLTGLAFLRAQFPVVPLMVVSGIDDPAVIRRAMALGCAGYIPKTLGTADIRAALQTALEGRVFLPKGMELSAASDDEHQALLQRFSSLTPQQLRVLMMVSEGRLNKQIAYELGVSEATIKAHVSGILTKLKVDSRTQAVILAAKIGDFGTSDVSDGG
jgi:DNA-binding NarL/FixJ family response regulator